MSFFFPLKMSAENLSLHYCLDTGKNNLYPMLALRSPGFALTDLLYPPLFGHNANGQLICQLCSLESKFLSLSAHNTKGREYISLTLTISEDFNWGNGLPLTAKDFYFTWALAKSSHLVSPIKQHWKMIHSIVLNPAKAKELTLIIPRDEFQLSSLTSLYAVPQQIVSPLLLKDPIPLGSYNRIAFDKLKNYSVLFYGPYILHRHESNGNVSLRQNDHYLEKGSQFKEIDVYLGSRVATKAPLKNDEDSFRIYLTDPFQNENCSEISSLPQGRLKRVNGPLLKQWLLFLNKKKSNRYSQVFWTQFITTLNIYVEKNFKDIPKRYLVPPSKLINDVFIEPFQGGISNVPSTNKSSSAFLPRGNTAQDPSMLDSVSHLPSIKIMNFKHSLKEPVISSLVATLRKLKASFEFVRQEPKKVWGNFEDDVSRSDIFIVEMDSAPFFALKLALTKNIYKYFLSDDQDLNQLVDSFDAYLYLENGGYRQNFQQTLSEILSRDRPPFQSMGGARLVIYLDNRINSPHILGLWDNLYEYSKTWKISQR